MDLESVIKVSMKRKPKSSNRNPEFNASVESRIQDCPGLSYMVTEYSHFHTNEWNKQETTSDGKKGAKMIGEGFKTWFGYNLMIAERSNKYLFLLFCYLFPFLRLQLSYLTVILTNNFVSLLDNYRLSQNSV